MSKYEIGQIIRGQVVGIEEYGIFIKVDNDVNGLIHISEVSNLFVRDINDYVEIGQYIKCKIIDVIYENNNLKLSIKDIDYEIEKHKTKKIIETKNAFFTLEKRLEVWKNKKLLEIEEKNCKNH